MLCEGLEEKMREWVRKKRENVEQVDIDKRKFCISALCVFRELKMLSLLDAYMLCKEKDGER